MKILGDSVKAELKENNGKISQDFVNNLAEHSDVVYLHPTKRTRICVLTLYSGHELVGYARVLDPANDIEEIGNRVAFENAKDKIWEICGAIALVV